MSMLSEQIKEIRAYAYAHEASGDAIYGTASILYQAADTIEALSAKLQAANGELERWHKDHINEKIKNPFANTSTLICINCDHKDEYIEELEAMVNSMSLDKSITYGKEHCKTQAIGIMVAVSGARGIGCIRTIKENFGRCRSWKNMNKIVKIYDRCDICHKRKAEFLCDMPAFRSHTLHIRLTNGLTDEKNSFKWITHTCDRKICRKCAVEVGGDIHFCKCCMDKLRQIIR